MGWKDLAGVIVMTLSLSGAALATQAQPADSYRALERIEIRELFDRYAWAVDLWRLRRLRKAVPRRRHRGCWSRGIEGANGAAQLVCWSLQADPSARSSQ